MKKLGLIAFANNSGLGAQSKRLLKVLNPSRVLVINSHHISVNKELHLEWYKQYQYFITSGLPKDKDIDSFLQNLTHVFVLEDMHNPYITYRARQLGIKVICQVNYEFCENLQKPYLPVPDKFLMPSYWKIKEMKKLFPDAEYLPPPIDPFEFSVVREINLAREGKPRFLHIVGTVAFKDRNGTLDLLQAVKLSKSDFELVVRTQHELPIEYFLDDTRVVYELDNKNDISELYSGFDALILPRRYGGLSLTTNEALVSGLPVVMTDISPNNRLLPKEWLVEAKYKSQIMTKTVIDTFSVDHKKLAQKIDWFCRQDRKTLLSMKRKAIGIGVRNFSEDVLKPKYDKLFTAS